MDFVTMGKVGSYIKQKNLSFAANYKVKTGQRVADNNGNLSFSQSYMFDKINKATKKTADEVKAARLRSIKQKLMNGKELSSEEMGFLLKNSPDLYKKARHAQEAREELKTELKGAETKQEAREILTRAMIKASAEACAELSALESGISFGGSFDGAISAESLSSTATENISVNATSTATENISVNTTSTTNENISVNETSTANENTSVNPTADKENSKQSILEKFTMTIRALEDEWTKFSNSEEYQDLPENYSDEKKVIEVPTRKFLDVIYNYRKSANKFNLEVDSWTNITLQS